MHNSEYEMIADVISDVLSLIFFGARWLSIRASKEWFGCNLARFSGRFERSAFRNRQAILKNDLFDLLYSLFNEEEEAQKTISTSHSISKT